MPTYPGRRWLRAAQLMVITGIGAGLGAYYIVRQRQNYINRWTPLDLPFRRELLDILALPGGGTLTYDNHGLHSTTSDRVIPVIDGIPDFGGASRATNALSTTMWYDTAAFLERLGWEPWRWGEEDVPRTWLAARGAAPSVDNWFLLAPVEPREAVSLAAQYPAVRMVVVDSRWSRLLETRRLALKRSVPNLYLVRGQLERLPLRTHSVAGAWAANGLEFSPDPDAVLREVLRVTEPGGMVAGATLVINPDTWHNWWLERSRRFPALMSAHQLGSRLIELGLDEHQFYQNQLSLGFVGRRA